MDNRIYHILSGKCQYHIVFIPQYRKKSTVWKAVRRCLRNHSNTMQI